MLKKLNKETVLPYRSSVLSLLNSANIQISTIKPSDWAEQNRYISKELTNAEGYFRYYNTPYTREIVDCLSHEVACDTVAVIKGAQIGFSAGVIENGIGYMISQDPANTLLLVGHDDSLKGTVNKIDQVIDGSGLRHLIHRTDKRARNVKSGDTDKRKDFQGGFLKIGLTNHKSLREMTMQNGFIDDFEAMKGSTEEAGDTVTMVEQRFAARAKKKKLFFISTPELKQSSNIEPEFLKGDQRYYHIPCPCCDELIKIIWEIPSEKNPEKMAGMTWELDESKKLISESVGYTCYQCDGFFTDANKMEWLQSEGYGGSAKWIPTAEPSRPGYRSYSISALYAPVFMYGWEYYVRKYLECTPFGRERDDREEAAYKSFVNLVLGQTYEFKGKPLNSIKLQQNTRNYEIGTIPEKLSIADGNGRIVLVVCAVDINGVEDDARIDYEIVAYSESGANYSINEGSIGTFERRSTNANERELFTYKHGVNNSVWPILEGIITSKIPRDTGGGLHILAIGLDVGYEPGNQKESKKIAKKNFVYQFADNSARKANIFCLKGSPTQFINESGDYSTYAKSKESGRGNLYLVESNHTKDLLSHDMDLNWSSDFASSQPFGFMNFPTPSGGKYTYNSFFSHFEAETKIMDSKGKFVWKRIKENNHKWDCRLYANVCRDIVLDKILASLKIKNGVWKDFCDYLLKRR